MILMDIFGPSTFIEIGHGQNCTFRAILNAQYIAHIVCVMLFHEASLHIKCNLFEEI